LTTSRKEGLGVSLLSGFQAVQFGNGLAAAACGRLVADIGGGVTAVDPGGSTSLARYLNHGKTIVSDGSDAAREALARADLIVCEGRPNDLRARRHDAASLRRLNTAAALVYISPFGQTGPKANDPATDLTLFFSSGIARLLTGQADDLDEPPIRAVGEQSAFIGGLAAACAGMHAALAAGPGTIVDVSIEEALATMAMGELANAGLTGKSRSRKRLTDGNGATVCILPASDGFAAISPREDRQWAAWLSVMGSPDWSRDPRFATKPDRVANWDALHALMSEWSRQHSRPKIGSPIRPRQPMSRAFRCASRPNSSLRRSSRIGASIGQSRSTDARSRRPERHSGCRPGMSVAKRPRGAGGSAGPGRCRSPASASSISAGSSRARPRHAIWRRWVPR
jgi:crotonobetainyl-CoA:carnitine CoA-transferase CaiB-like acyl-CoA transferase